MRAGAGAIRQQDRRRRLPLPVLLPLAVGAVALDRFGRRGALLLIAPLLVICVALSGFGLQLAGRSGHATPAEGRRGATAVPTTVATASAPVAAVIAPTRTATATTTATAMPTATATEAPPTPPVKFTSGAAPTATATNAPAPTAPPTIALAPTSVPPTPTLTINQAKPLGTTVIPILMYHYVRVVNDKQDTIGINLSVKPDLFAAQMQYLADKGYTTLTMREVHAILAGQQPLPPKPVALTFDDGYRDFYTAAWPVLRQHNFKATSYVVTNFIGWDAYMTWPMLQELAATGLVEIGAHTRSHGDLRGMSQARRKDEIFGSKAILEEGLGRPVVSFCYPAGFYNADALALVKQAGFLTATTVQPGAKQNLQWAYELPRVRVNGPDTLAQWAAKLP